MKTVARIIVVTIGLGISAMANPAPLQPNATTANDAMMVPNDPKRIGIAQPDQAAEQHQTADQSESTDDNQEDTSFFGKPGSTKRWCWYIGSGVVLVITATAIYLYYRGDQAPQPPSAVPSTLPKSYNGTSAPSAVAKAMADRSELRRDAASKPLGAETGQPNPVAPPSQPTQPQSTPVTTQAQPTATIPTAQARSTPAATPPVVAHVKPIVPAAPTPQLFDKPIDDDAWAAVVQDPEAKRCSFAAIRAIDITPEGQAMLDQAFDTAVDAADAKTLKELRSQTL